MHVEVSKRYVDACFTQVAPVQVGGKSQPSFVDWADRELIPRLRG